MRGSTSRLPELPPRCATLTTPEIELALRVLCSESALGVAGIKFLGQWHNHRDRSLGGMTFILHGLAA
jgi:hypothetical protein